MVALPTLLFLASFVALRVQQPDLPRNFRIVGGLPVAILIVIPPAVLVMTQFTLAVAGDALDQLGDGQVMLFGVPIPYPPLMCNCTVLLLGLLGHMSGASCTAQFFRRYCCGCCCSCRDSVVGARSKPVGSEGGLKTPGSLATAFVIGSGASNAADERAPLLADDPRWYGSNANHTRNFGASSDDGSTGRFRRLSVQSDGTTIESANDVIVDTSAGTLGEER